MGLLFENSYRMNTVSELSSKLLKYMDDVKREYSSCEVTARYQRWMIKRGLKF